MINNYLEEPSANGGEIKRMHYVQWISSVILHCEMEQQKKATDLIFITVETNMLVVKEQKKAKNLALIFIVTNASLREELNKAMELANTTDTKECLQLC